MNVYKTLVHGIYWAEGATSEEMTAVANDIRVAQTHEERLLISQRSQEKMRALQESPVQPAAPSQPVSAEPVHQPQPAQKKTMTDKDLFYFRNRSTGTIRNLYSEEDLIALAKQCGINADRHMRKDDIIAMIKGTV